MRYFCIIAVLAAITASCQAFGEKAIITCEVNPMGWDADEPVLLRYDNMDTVSLCRVSLIVHKQKDIGGNLKVDIRTVTPDDISFTEPLVLDMDSEQTPYRDNVRLNRVGEYIFSISPSGGRSVKGVFSVGMVIE